MARRSRDWKERVSKDLIKNKSRRRGLYMELLEEGLTWRDALLNIVQIIG
jgi:hypothetical protein